MQPDKNNKVLLLILATESIAANLKGCAGRVESVWPATEGPTAAAVGKSRAIDHFGPFIIARWAEWLGGHDSDEHEKAFRALAELAAPEARQQIEELLRQHAPTAAEEDQRVAADFLAAIPPTVRDMLLSEAPGDGIGTLGVRFTGERSLLRFLPLNVPPFPAASELPASPYNLEELLGVGGFGAVYRATNRFEQNTPPRAIKFCLNRDMLASLKRERDLLDRLMKAGSDTRWSDRVVKLYGHNLDAPIPFLVYEYIPGGNLIARLAAIQKRTGTSLRPSQVVGLIRRICEPVAFAHSMGLVHRDIKPSNILVSGNTIKLADFGIGGVVATYAAHTSQIGLSDFNNLSLAEKGSVFRGAGTPLYMSPEQRRGEAPDPRHDVYSIGVMWYQLLVGDCTRELHPGWADELADEHDIPTFQIDLIRSCIGYVKKRPATAGALLAMLPSPTTSQTPTVRMAKTRTHCVVGSHDATVNALAFTPDSRRLLSGGGDGSVRLWDVESSQKIAEMRPNARAILSAAVSPDGRRALLGCDPRVAWLWDLMRGTELACLSGHTRPVTRVAFSPDGRRAITGSEDASIRLWHVASGRELLRIDEHRKGITGLQFTPDGLFILSCSDDGTLGIWDSETGWETRQLPTGGEWPLCLAVSGDGRRVACGGKEHITLWSLDDGQVLGSLVGHTLPTLGLAFPPGGQLLLSGSMDRSVRLWDVSSRKQVEYYEGHTSGVTAVAISPDGRMAASGGYDRTVRLWSLPEQP
jgi:serine/threonine protein kinase